MSDNQRPSGRQPAQNVTPSRLSSRSPLPHPSSASGRVAPQMTGTAPSARMPAAHPGVPSNSGRMQSAPLIVGPTASGRMQSAPLIVGPASRPASSARMQTAPLIVGPTSRPASSNSGRVPTLQPSSRSVSANEIIPEESTYSPHSETVERASSPRLSTRSSSSQSQSSLKRKSGKKELLIAASVITVLATVCIVLFVMRNKEKADVHGAIENRERALKSNWAKGKEVFNKVDSASRLYILGKEEFSADKIITPFKSDPDIYNVIYKKFSKDKKQTDKTDTKTAYEDRQTLYNANKPECDEGELHMSYGFGDAEKTVPVIIAVKNYKGAEGDTVNTGGSITITIKTVMDPIFENIKNPPPPEKPKK